MGGPNAQGKSQPQTAPQTQFSRWRTQCGLTKAEAAEVLGKSPAHIYRMDRGGEYDGTPATPTIDTRLPIAAVAKHGRIKPWPE